MPLYQQGGLPSSKGTLQGLPQIVQAYLRQKILAQEMGQRERKLSLDEELGRGQLDLSREQISAADTHRERMFGESQKRTGIAQTSADATKLLREYQLERAKQGTKPTTSLQQVLLPDGSIGFARVETGIGGNTEMVPGLTGKPSAGQTINVNTGETTPLEKSTKGFVEKEIEQIDSILLTIGEIDKLTEDRFFTYPGQIGVGSQKLAEKVTGSPVLGNKLLGSYAAWKSMSQELYLQKRKQITGVAAKPEEAAEIAQSIPDPSKDSPTQFRVKQVQLRTILTKHRERLIQFRAAGIPNPTKEQLAMVPLDSIQQGGGASDSTSLEGIDKELAEIEKQLGALE